MSDSISRQTVLTLFEERFLELQTAKRLPENKVQEYEQSGVNWCINTVRDVPSVENKGEWIAYDHGMGLVYLKCPFCGTTIDKRHVEHNFCGKCGAKLSGEKSGFDMKGRSCTTCKNSDDEFSGECYECIKNIQNHYEPKENEDQ